MPVRVSASASAHRPHPAIRQALLRRFTGLREMASATAPSAVATAFLQATSSISMKSKQGMPWAVQYSLTDRGMLPPNNVCADVRRLKKRSISRSLSWFSAWMVCLSFENGTGQRMISEASIASFREKEGFS